VWYLKLVDVSIVVCHCDCLVVSVVVLETLLVANSNNVQVVSVSVSEGKESRPTITSPPADQSTFRYSSQRQQTVQISQQSQSISESPFEKRPTPHSIPNSSGEVIVGLLSFPSETETETTWTLFEFATNRTGEG
jgi:hypothetical protein